MTIFRDLILSACIAIGFVVAVEFADGYETWARTVNWLRPDSAPSAPGVSAITQADPDDRARTAAMDFAHRLIRNWQEALGTELLGAIPHRQPGTRRFQPAL